MARQTEILSSHIKMLEGMKGSKTYIGKKVFSKSGEYVGIVRDILLKEDHLEGILAKGKATIFIDKEYLANDAGAAIMLSMDPVTLLMGKQVFDSEGRKLGKVIGVERKSTSNTYTGIIIRRSFFRKPFVIPHEEISVQKTNIILKGAHSQ